MKNGQGRKIRKEKAVLKRKDKTPQVAALPLQRSSSGGKNVFADRNPISFEIMKREQKDIKWSCDMESVLKYFLF